MLNCSLFSPGECITLSWGNDGLVQAGMRVRGPSVLGDELSWVMNFPWEIYYSFQGGESSIMGDVLLNLWGWIISHGGCTTHSRGMTHQSWEMYYSFQVEESSVMEDVLLIPGG